MDDARGIVCESLRRWFDAGLCGSLPLESRRRRGESPRGVLVRISCYRTQAQDDLEDAGE